MATECWSSVRGTVARFTKLDSCCTPLAAATPCAQVVTDGFISVQYSPEISEAEDIEVKNAGGKICVTDPGCDELKWFNLQLTLCNIDPDVVAFVTGSPLVVDYSGKAVGNRIQAGTKCDANFALEVWTDIPSQDCAGALGKEYGYFLVPCITSGIIDEFTIENDALQLVLNAKSKSGSGWGVGPYLVDPADASNTPGPLIAPIGATDHLDLHVTTITPPEPVCGCQAMPAALPAATGATAGTPGAFTPPGSVPPANLAAMTGVTASPTSAWTTGQYVTLGDSSQAHWSGTAWAAGPAA